MRGLLPKRERERDLRMRPARRHDSGATRASCPALHRPCAGRRGSQTRTAAAWFASAAPARSSMCTRGSASARSDATSASFRSRSATTGCRVFVGADRRPGAARGLGRRAPGWRRPARRRPGSRRPVSGVGDGAEESTGRGAPVCRATAPDPGGIQAPARKPRSRYSASFRQTSVSRRGDQPDVDHASAAA